MLRRTLNLGILAHVDAGKTTLTERLLYAAGAIDEVGSVDKGTTQTDTLALEQQRGITIRSAVVSFAIGDVTVNLVDTPGHPDFIAEVERVLGVLDGVVLVVSAVEGVQSQTRVLMRALQRLRLPALVFVNKTDRAGADPERVLAEIVERLTPTAVGVDDPTRLVEVLAENDPALLAAYVEGEAVPAGDVRAALARQTQQALVHPVFSGSAITGDGIDTLQQGIAELLPAGLPDPDGPAQGVVFKIERGAGGEKIAYVRMFSGTLRIRDTVRVGTEHEHKVTAVSVFADGTATQRQAVVAGEIGYVWGLAGAKIGDGVGDGSALALGPQFPPPTLESVVTPVDPESGARLRIALAQLAEQDPLINMRQDESGRMSVSLYGEVQKEVIESTLADDFGVAVEFRETTPLYVERPVGSGEAIEVLNTDSNPYRATVGLRVEPAAAGTGVEVRVEVDHRTVPLYVFKKEENFAAAMDGYIRDSLRRGLYGWEVIDCVVTMTDSNYSSPDGPAATRGPLSTAADFRKLTPVVVRQALADAETIVCEPTVRAAIEAPADAVGAVIAALARLGAAVETPIVDGERAAIEAVLPAGRADDLQRELAGLTRGEGAMDTQFAGYQPVVGERPLRS